MKATNAQAEESAAELPTTGGMRPGPVVAIPTSIAPVRRNGARPVALRIPAIQVDTDIELAEIIVGVLQDPSGPGIVAWYIETSRVGVPGNVVLSGHLDYRGTGPAVFYRLGELVPEDDIEITGNDGRLYRYRVAWNRVYDATTAPVAEIAGPTRDEVITLITCGGTFHPETGEYDHRVVVRAVPFR